MAHSLSFAYINNDTQVAMLTWLSLSLVDIGGWNAPTHAENDN
jgi:hypothetical protein